MKNLRILSSILIIVILVSVMNLGVCASGTTYSAEHSYFIYPEYTFDPDNFDVNVTIDKSKILAFDDESTEFSCVINSIVANDIDYLTDPQGFCDIFTAENFEGAYIYITFTVEFVSDKCFGALDYTIDIDGFSAPPSLGIGGLDDAISSLPVPKEISISGTFDEFPKIDASTIKTTQIPEKNSYYDTEKYDANGLVVTCSLSNGNSGTITYNDETAYIFEFNPSTTEKLSVLDTEVAILLDGTPVFYAPIKVSHQYSQNYVNITTDIYTDSKPGYHAIVCEGCGDAYDAHPHTPTPLLGDDGQPLVDEEGNVLCWTSNNDQTFLKNGTESSICQDCGAVLTRNTFGTADYNEVLGNYHFIRVILDYINMLLSIINGAL